MKVKHAESSEKKGEEKMGRRREIFHNPLPIL
jgi:hypothetical protein